MPYCRHCRYSIVSVSSGCRYLHGCPRPEEETLFAVSETGFHKRMQSTLTLCAQNLNAGGDDLLVAGSYGALQHQSAAPGT